MLGIQRLPFAVALLTATIHFIFLSSFQGNLNIFFPLVLELEQSTAAQPTMIALAIRLQRDPAKKRVYSSNNAASETARHGCLEPEADADGASHDPLRVYVSPIGLVVLYQPIGTIGVFVLH